MLKHLVERLNIVQVTHKSPVLGFSVGLVLGLFLLGCEPKAHEPQASRAVDTSLCNFKSGPCTKTVADVDLELTISPWQTPSEQPLQLSITTSQPLSNIKVKVQGRDMFMGIIPVKLNQIDENLHQGNLIYGSCSGDYMVWSAIVSYEIDGVEKFTSFDFLADNPG
ncbi:MULTISPECIES: hypothetical protein [unclassified Shewanella]|uniref:hypothetical protein n=1 Tax=unclassified Shewanella TaxID=196818 RepID=UPI001BC7D5D8|nr:MULTISPECIES: hypothetical protein [unclassified Shewanella]GIU10857.1 hypothetical protein TUM4444_15820 [Shewanella sp. MBTL60-112-B1]GIU32990.1 hypothetical protein TUM4445_19420 [Shewanella sp. MBTL60-112-B2]